MKLGSVLFLSCVLLCGCQSAPDSASVLDLEPQEADPTIGVGRDLIVVIFGRQLICKMRVERLQSEAVIEGTMLCTDGRTGRITLTLTPDGRSGSGIAIFTDGSTSAVVFGSPEQQSKPRERGVSVLETLQE